MASVECFRQLGDSRRLRLWRLSDVRRAPKGWALELCSPLVPAGLVHNRIRAPTIRGGSVTRGWGRVESLHAATAAPNLLPNQMLRSVSLHETPLIKAM